ncbi:MAG: hypothetical protein R6W78_04660 [Bacteroidales bacterium]
MSTLNNLMRQNQLSWLVPETEKTKPEKWEKPEIMKIEKLEIRGVKRRKKK